MGLWTFDGPYVDVTVGSERQKILCINRESNLSLSHSWGASQCQTTKATVDCDVGNCVKLERTIHCFHADL